MYHRPLLIFVLLLWISFNSSAQIRQPNRYEVEVENEEDYYDIIPPENLGLMLIRKNTDLIEKNKTGWECIALDTALNERRSDKIFIETDYDLKGYDYASGKIYLLFENKKNGAAEFYLCDYDFLSGTNDIVKIKRLFDIDLTEFEVLDEVLILGGYINLKPAVVFYSLKDKKTKVLPGFYFDKSKLLQIDVNDEAKTIKVLTSLQAPGMRNLTMNIRTFSSDGEMIENSTLEPDERVSLVTGRIVNVNTYVSLVAGTYANRRSEYSQGIFLTRIDKGGDKKLMYYDYGDLDNFFNYMKARHFEKVKDKIHRKKIKGKKAKFNYRLLVHDVIEYNNTFTLIGEAYYPYYSDNYGNYGSYGSYSSYGFWSNPYYNPNYSFSRFDGYKYTHAIVIGFDRKGRVLWDNSFEINDATSFALKPLVQASIKDNRIVLLYNYENVLRTKIIQGKEVLEGKSFNTINLKFQDDEAQDNDSKFGGLERWYNDTFYAYGVQRIRNTKETGVKLNREVFFVNKIIYY
jgi:hypothetical protein